MMTRRIVLLLFVLAAPLLAAQERDSWLIAQYSADLGQAEAAIQERLADGYVPMGLEVDEGSAVSVLYVDGPFAARLDLAPSAARLDRFSGDDMAAVEEGMNRVLADGWFPIDISRSEEAFYVLFVRVPWSVQQWRFAYGMFSGERLQAAIEILEEDGMALAGISLYEGVQAWYLFVQSPDWRPERLYFTSYLNDNESIIAGFNGDMAEGWIPAGFAVGTSAITVQYVR